MIVRPPISAFGLLFMLRGSIVPVIAPRVIAVVIVSILITLAELHWPGRLPNVTPVPFTLLGLVLSIFLGFRNNACYDRWWEARKLWGRMIFEIRCLMRDTVSLLPVDGGESGTVNLHRRIGSRAIAFAHALRLALRMDPGDTVEHEIVRWLPPGEWLAVAGSRNRAGAILRRQTAELAGCLSRREISDILYAIMDARITSLAEVQSACERLRNTPMPFAYSLLLHRTAWLFCLLLPFGMAGSLGIFTPFLVALLAYAFFGLDAIGDELEEPFGLLQNDLPLDAMVRVIEIDVLEALGETDLPEPLIPKNYILM